MTTTRNFNFGLYFIMEDGYRDFVASFNNANAAEKAAKTALSENNMIGCEYVITIDVNGETVNSLYYVSYNGKDFSLKSYSI